MYALIWKAIAAETEKLWDDEFVFLASVQSDRHTSESMLQKEKQRKRSEEVESSAHKGIERLLQAIKALWESSREQSITDAGFYDPVHMHLVNLDKTLVFVDMANTLHDCLRNYSRIVLFLSAPLNPVRFTGNTGDILSLAGEDLTKRPLRESEDQSSPCVKATSILSIHPTNCPSACLNKPSLLSIRLAEQTIQPTNRLSICPSIHMVNHPSIRLAIHPSIHPSVHSVICQSILPSMHPFIHPTVSTHSLIYQCIRPSIHPSNHLADCLSIHLSIHPSTHPSIKLSFCPSINLPIH
ncbi:hypothetical protein DNTS_033981 [Danionella cerebrum]|uniref:Uncharacterized protein n=1 Tax=Danionella cerebrum TaxID=2873325 RepID=A0A553PEI7_9TELE|nr:hypothetical protein DNTS_033981 [Danionella translucida]